MGYRVDLRNSGEWRNWQTRRLQVPVSFGTWGFKSPLAHSKVLVRTLSEARKPPISTGSLPNASTRSSTEARADLVPNWGSACEVGPCSGIGPG